MSRFFGEIRQAGYVVEDIHAAMRHWSEVLGIGPWFYAERVPVENFHYRGEPSPIEVSVALANSGPLQVELIQQRNDAPSMYRDFRAAGRVGLQHVAYWTQDFDADLARLTARGLRIGMQGNVGRNGRYVYFETEMHPGTVVELSEVAGPKGTLFRMIREASEGWNGSDPVRPFPDLATLAG
ncbi:VOC family protein [Rhodovastum atsumiense]|uniref:VOC family protein n=1 Tax=Rhodovastum atsumiense TaxID=504468 RepID=A0A5M6IMG3_9PROT|nr:VOC family protein [Rhodovastum atsumiense]KAA5609137.1 VOC family protein [Rhodovastum atsumiense]CAH2601256.1 VOC family protein [Rhodovastum atsumiense]